MGKKPCVFILSIIVLFILMLILEDLALCISMERPSFIKQSKDRLLMRDLIQQSGFELRNSKVHEKSSSHVTKSILSNNLIDFSNSTFKSSNYALGDFTSSCKDKRWNSTFAYLKAPFHKDQPNSMEITFWYPFEQYFITDCVNVRENYHFCAVSNGSEGIAPTPFCIKIEEKDEKFKLGLNTNFYDCLIEKDFEIELKCDLFLGNIILIYESPGEKTVLYRNAIVIIVLIPVVVTCCLMTCIAGIYCFLNKRRKSTKLNNGVVPNSEELDDDKQAILNTFQ